jgi:hypothetical protein
MTNVFARVRQGLCGLRGHEAMMKFERERVFLTCYSCGYESPGWTVNRAPIASSSCSDDSPTALRRPRLAGAH